MSIQYIEDLPEFAQDSRDSPVFAITDEMELTITTKIKNNLVRIWRAPLRELDPWEMRTPMAILEVTELWHVELKPLGLRWSYSKHEDAGYVLHGYVPGSKKFEKLEDLYKHCTDEIQYFVRKLEGRNGQ